MKQTAVEWLVQEINKLTGLTIAIDEPCVEQAKEIEKQQAIEFGYDVADYLACGVFTEGDIEDRYNEFFNSEEDGKV
jgi:hypothetical protein